MFFFLGMKQENYDYKFMSHHPYELGLGKIGTEK